MSQALGHDERSMLALLRANASSPCGPESLMGEALRDSASSDLVSQMSCPVNSPLAHVAPFSATGTDRAPASMSAAARANEMQAQRKKRQVAN